MRLCHVAFVLILAAVPIFAETPEFDLKEPISLDLKDAKLTEVITLLGALANVPVSIAPEVQGTVSVQTDNIPYERVLQILGQQNGLSIRIEGGKLVATSLKSSSAHSADAPAFDRPVSGPRIPVEEYAKASSRSWPLFFRVRGAGGTRCVRLGFEGAETFEVPVPGSDSPAIVSQLFREPISRMQYVAVEFPGMTPRALALRAFAEMPGFVSGDGPFGWSFLAEPRKGEVCSEAVTHKATGNPQVLLRFEAEEKLAEGKELLSTPLLSAPQVQLLAGSVFGTMGGLGDPGGQHREIWICGYLAADGKSVAAILAATAIWRDPADGREYVYAQTLSGPEIPFVPLGPEAQVAATLPAGSALPNAVELTVHLGPAPTPK